MERLCLSALSTLTVFKPASVRYPGPSTIWLAARRAIATTKPRNCPSRVPFLPRRNVDADADARILSRDEVIASRWSRSQWGSGQQQASRRRGLNRREVFFLVGDGPSFDGDVRQRLPPTMNGQRRENGKRLGLVRSRETVPSACLSSNGRGQGCIHEQKRKGNRPRLTTSGSVQASNGSGAPERSWRMPRMGWGGAHSLPSEGRRGGNGIEVKLPCLFFV